MQEKIIGFTFTFIGILSTIVDVGLLYIITTRLEIWYIASTTISYSCGIGVNFSLNKYLNFQDPSQEYVKQFFTFTLISLLSLALTLAIL